MWLSERSSVFVECVKSDEVQEYFKEALNAVDFDIESKLFKV